MQSGATVAEEFEEAPHAVDGLDAPGACGVGGSPDPLGKNMGKAMDARPVVVNSFRAISSISGRALTGTFAPLSLVRRRRAASIAGSSSMLFPAGAMKDSVS